VCLAPPQTPPLKGKTVKVRGDGNPTTEFESL
jgi:hypothetical protein